MTALLLTLAMTTAEPARLRKMPQPLRAQRGEQLQAGAATLGCVNLPVYKQVAVLRRANDRRGWERYVADGRAVKLEAGTRLRVLKRYAYQPSGVRGADTARGPAIPPNALEVRVLGGDHKDKVLFLAEEDMVRDPGFHSPAKGKRTKAAVTDNTGAESG